jgi:hypothetical protein
VPKQTGAQHVFGGAGGAGEAPRRSTPWVNLGGGGWPDRFFAGGRIHDAGTEIDHVELRFANGITLHDDIEEGIALFITDQTVALPAIVALINPSGKEIATHPLPGS